MFQRSAVTDGLMLLDIKPTSFSDDFSQYRDSESLLYIKGCRREVLIGNETALKSAPNLESEGITLYQNTEAYAHLLTYITGLISRTRGESQIVSQFRRAYSELGTRSPQAAVNLRELYQDIIFDNSIVRNNITSSLIPAFYEACANELSEPEGNDVVLVIAHTHSRSGKPNAETENIVRYLGGNKRKAAQTIVFTHPDANHLRTVHSYFLSQSIKGKLTSSIEMLPFEQALDANTDLQRFNRVFVCFPMGNSSEIDAKIIKEWSQREALGGQLIHLGGSKKSERYSTGAWESPDLWSFVAPEQITEWQTRRKKQNDETIKAGIKACEMCADIRSKNKRPSRRTLLPKLAAQL